MIMLTDTTGRQKKKERKKVATIDLHITVLVCNSMVATQISGALARKLAGARTPMTW